jgi:hypothetical protein
MSNPFGSWDEYFAEKYGNHPLLTKPYGSQPLPTSPSTKDTSSMTEGHMRIRLNQAYGSPKVFEAGSIAEFPFAEARSIIRYGFGVQVLD